MRIGIDLGGTKIEGLALAPGGRELQRVRVDTPRGYRETIEAISGIVAQLDGVAGVRCPVGVGIPGAIEPATARVKNANSTWLNGEPLGIDLAMHLRREVRLTNDANCFALSEATDGAGKGADVVFGVILGTGVGGGIVVRGHCLDGVNLSAGEWGHNPLPWPKPAELPGPDCYCGRKGCIEAWLAGPAFALDHRRVTGQELTTREIVQQAYAGDRAAAASVVRYQERLARALATVINLLDPDVIVLGGGMSNLPGLADAVTSLLPKHVFSPSIATRVVKNVHGDSSGVRGAAWLWPES